MTIKDKPNVEARLIDARSELEDVRHTYRSVLGAATDSLIQRAVNQINVELEAMQRSGQQAFTLSTLFASSPEVAE